MKYALMILFLSAGFSAAADDAESKKLLKDLEGSYKVTAAEGAGEAQPAEFLASFEKVSIKGDKFSMTRKGKDGKSETRAGTITVDATKKPAHFDLNANGGINKGETVLSIIALDGETLKICSNDSPNPKRRRPDQFKTTMDDNYIFLTMKKVKE